jgi:hypothetical protein
VVVRWQLVGLVAAVALAAAFGPASRAPASRTFVDAPTHVAVLHFDGGRQALSFGLSEPSGVILLYRISVPQGTEVRGSARLPRITVPLRIATTPGGPSSNCSALPRRVRCTVGEEWCPMPAGTWVFRVEKLTGPAGDVKLWFRVGEPGRDS